MLLGLRTAIYPVANLTRAKQWYEQVTGVKPYFDQPFYVGFSIGGFELGLLPNGTPGTAGPQPLWGVADIAAVLERLIALGATQLEAVTEVGDGDQGGGGSGPVRQRAGFDREPAFQGI